MIPHFPCWSIRTLRSEDALAFLRTAKTLAARFFANNAAWCSLPFAARRTFHNFLDARFLFANKAFTAPDPAIAAGSRALRSFLDAQLVFANTALTAPDPAAAAGFRARRSFLDARLLSADEAFTALDPPATTAGFRARRWRLDLDFCGAGKRSTGPLLRDACCHDHFPWDFNNGGILEAAPRRKPADFAQNLPTAAVVECLDDRRYGFTSTYNHFLLARNARLETACTFELGGPSSLGQNSPWYI